MILKNMKDNLKKQSRGRKTLINIITELLLQFITIICGFILPKLILSNFGSTYNGIVHSISQFIGCVELLKSGIGSVTRAALYKPLANNDRNEISKVVFTTERFLRKISLIFIIFIIVFSIVYPLIIKEKLPFYDIFLLVLILSISTFVQYYLGLSYQMVLQADQKNYIISLVQMITIIINTLVSAFLIFCGGSIHIVKFGSAIVFIIPPIFYSLYVKRKYNLNKKVSLREDLISQRWDAFGHQVANFININTDVMVITVFLRLSEVSVYSIYNMITYSLKKIISAITSSVTGAFGNVYAKGEKEILLISFKQYEHLLFWVSTIIYTSTAFLILPFVNIYTNGILDANYNRPLFAVLMCVACFFSCVKLPYETIIYVAGHFKDTKKAAYIESAINIILSCILVNVFGIVGIIIGTIIASIYRLIFYNYYVSKRLINYNSNKIIFKFLFTIISIIMSYLIISLIKFNIYNYITWLLYAIVVFSIVLLCSFIISFLMYKDDTCGIIVRLKKLIIK